jgi:hypothetical protein
MGGTMSLIVNDLTASSPVYTDSSKRLVSGPNATRPVKYLSEYASLDAALITIGSTQTSLVIDTDAALTQATALPATLDICEIINFAKFTGSYALSIGKMSADPLHQIFSGPTVTFAAGAVAHVRPEWWGFSTGASGATNTAAIVAMMATISNADGLFKKIEFTPGKYSIAGAIGAQFDKSYLKINFNGAIFDYGTETGVAVQFGATAGASDCEFNGPLTVERTYSYGGAAATALTETGFLYTSMKNFTTRKLAAVGFEYGHKFLGTTIGVSYGWHYDIEANDCLEGIYIGDNNTGNPWVTYQQFYGGRIAFATSRFTSLAGTRNVHIEKNYRRPDGIDFWGMVMENAVERKILCAGDAIGFHGCYLDAGAYNTNFGAYVGYPYAAQITGASSTAGSAVLSKTAHSLDCVVGDIVYISASGSSRDTGETYYVESFDDDTITLDRALCGNSVGGVSFTYYRTNIEFTSDSHNCQINNCNNLVYNSVSDKGEFNTVIDGQLGISVGKLDPPYGTSDADYRKGILNLGNTHGGVLTALMSNKTATATNGSIELGFGGMDTNGALRKHSGILAKPTSSGAGYVSADLHFRTNDAGSYGTRAIVKADGKFGVGTTAPKNLHDIAGALCVGASVAGKETAKTNGQHIEGSVVIGEKFRIVEAGDSGSQVRNWRLYGIPGTTTYYWKLVYSGSNPTVTVYNDSAGLDAQRVCSGSGTGSGTITLAELNSSGITGTVYVDASSPSDDDDLASNTLTCTADSSNFKTVVRDISAVNGANALWDNYITDGIVAHQFKNDAQAWTVQYVDGSDGDAWKLNDSTNSKIKIKVNPNTGDIELNNGKVTISDATDTTALDTGSLQTAGGASVKKNLWVGEDVNLATGKGVKVNAIKVLGDQRAAIADAAGGDEVTKINAILAALRAHGLIAT